MSRKICTTKTSDSMIKVEENGRKAVFKNKSNEKYSVSVVDGCLITDGVRCDYLVSSNKSTSVLVELKGTDIQHAVEQLLGTVEREEVKPLIGEKVGFLVICRRFPRFDTYVAKAKVLCAKRYKAGFHVVCDRGEFDIERVAAIDGPY